MLRKLWVAAAAALFVPLAATAQETTKVAPGTPVTITVQPAPAEAPTVSITLKDRHGHATPVRSGCTHTAGGNIDVQQPSPDTIVVTFGGVAVAAGHPHGSVATFDFNLEQCLDIVFEKPEVKAAKLTIEGRVIGLLRGGKAGAASVGCGTAAVGAGGAAALSISAPSHAVGGCENLSINDKVGPVSGPVGAGPHTLAMTWQVTASHPRGLLGKAASAEFAPDALDPLWISAKEPFKGAAKKDFGFQVTIKVADDTPPEPKKGNGK